MAESYRGEHDPPRGIMSEKKPPIPEKLLRLFTGKEDRGRTFVSRPFGGIEPNNSPTVIQADKITPDPPRPWWEGQSINDIIRQITPPPSAPPGQPPPVVPPAGGPSPSEPSLPRNWKEAAPYIVWVVLILGFGLEFAAALVRGEWARAAVSLALMLGLTAMALHWKQIRAWFGVRSPAWVVAALMLALEAIVLSPFMEERRWPFELTVPSTPQAPTVVEAPQQERDNLIARHKNLSQAGRGKLSDALDDMAQALNEGDALSRAVSDIQQTMARDLINPGHVAQHLGAELTALKNVSKSAADLTQHLVLVAQDHGAYADEIKYVGNGNTAYPDAVKRTADEIGTFLAEWARVPDNSEYLLRDQRAQLNQAIMGFRVWLDESKARLKEMRDSL